MKTLGRILCVLCLLSCVGLAQVKAAVQWKCDKASDSHSIDVGDKASHSYAVDQINCTAMKGEIEGVKVKSGMGTELIEINGNKLTGHGEFVQTMANGDKNFYTYQFWGTTKDGALVNAGDKWTLREGGGALKGAKFSGTCKGASNPDQSVTWDCPGEYTLAAK